jgi:hypothetical protein
MTFLRLLSLSLPLLASACLVDGEPDRLVDVGPAAQEERCAGCSWGPPLNNTHGLNGLPVAALDTNGDPYDGWILLGVEVVLDAGVADHPVHDVRVEDGLLFAKDDDKQVFHGADFVGAAFTVGVGTPDKGYEVMVLQVSDFVEDGPRSRYTFVSGPTIHDPEAFTCAQDPDTGERAAILFTDLDVDASTGTHLERPDTIYFGCISGAVGKAAMWGYGPSATGPDVHQTATRVVRADYCGDGQTHTTQGTGLQLRDVLGVHDFVDPSYATEAMWGPHGAACLLEPRSPDFEDRTIECGGQPLPVCSAGDGFGDWPGALLWTKTWPAYGVAGM